MEESKSKTNWILRIILAYVLRNVALFLVNPYSSPWHYKTHHPLPINVVQPGDSVLSLREITGVLADIDLAYAGRAPTAIEEARIVALREIAN